MRPIWTNIYGRLWMMKPEQRYMSAVGVHRVMKEGSKAVIILRAHAEWLEESGALPEDGVTFNIAYGCVGRPEEYREKDLRISIIDCTLKQSWIPRPVVLSPGEAKQLYVWFEYVGELVYCEGLGIGASYTGPI